MDYYSYVRGRYHNKPRTSLYSRFFNQRTTVEKRTVLPFLEAHSYRTIAMSLEQRLRSEIGDLPDYMTHDLMHDIFQMYYLASKNRIVMDENRARFDLLYQVYNPICNTITSSNIIYSYIFALHTLKMLFKLLRRGEIDEAQQMIDAISGQQDAPAETMEKFKSLVEQFHRVSVQEAFENIENLKEVAEVLESDGLHAGKDIHAMLSSLDDLEDIHSQISECLISVNDVDRIFKQILTKSGEYFYSKRIPSNVSILKSKKLRHISNFFFLMDEFQYAHIGDLLTKSYKPVNKLDYYLDISGSMSASQEKVNGNHLVNSVIGKIVGLKLYKMGLLDNLYTFNSDIAAHETNMASFLTQTTCGGTDIERVLKHAMKTNKPSIIFTDMEDTVSLYTPDVFIVGIGDFNPTFLKKEAKAFFENNQMVKYEDGNLRVF